MEKVKLSEYFTNALYCMYINSLILWVLTRIQYIHTEQKCKRNILNVGPMFHELK